jgi:hypothetical protein
MAVVGEIARTALELALEVQTGRETRPRRELPDVVQTDRVDPRQLDRWVGSYATQLGNLHVSRKGDVLVFEAFGRSFFLKPVERGGMGVWTGFWGLWDIQPGEMSQHRYSLVDVGDKKVVVRHVLSGRRYVGEMYEPVPASATWRSRAGGYRLIRREGDYALLRGAFLYVDGHGQLILQPVLNVPVGGPIPGAALHPLNDSEAVTEGTGRGRGTRLRFDAQGRLHHAGLVLVRDATILPPKPGRRLRGDPLNNATSPASHW